MQDPEGEAQQQLVRPLCVALVDTTGTEEYLELVRCSLLAALEVLPPCTGFGLATFSDKVSNMSSSRLPAILWDKTSTLSCQFEFDWSRM